METEIKLAIKSLEQVERCGCWSEAPGEGIDPNHKVSIASALRRLRRVVRVIEIERSNELYLQEQQ
jgi:hypothetical protein